MFLDQVEQIKLSTEPIYAVHWCPYLPSSTHENDAHVDLFVLAGRKLWFLLVQTTSFKSKSRILFAVEPRVPTASNKRPRSSAPDKDVEYFYAVATTVAQSSTHLGNLNDLLCVAGGIGTCVTVVNVHQRRVVAVVPCAGNDINAIRTHPTRWSWVAVASKDCSIRIIDIARGTTLAVLGGVAGHAQQVLDLDWSTRGDWLVSGAADNAVKFWRVPPAEILTRVHGEPVAVAGPAKSTQWPHANFVDAVRVAREGSGGRAPWVWTKSVEGEILMWRLGNDDDDGDGQDDAEVLPRLCAETEERGPRTTPVLRLTYPTPNHWFFKLDVIDDLIAVGSASGSVHIWHIERALAATVDLPRPETPAKDWTELADRLNDAVMPAAPNVKGAYVELEVGECVRGVGVAGYRGEGRSRVVIAVTDGGSVVVAQLRME
ncbi:hypothetical protein AMAG_14271 [Allomyces macrogynus ATCC 38327]|uniref:Uncharacterized protein n=1 Tax=Allomyces macrogynus (strain ATCC 38327) TaxID=578462 RepID=A0A0L0T4U1_ALLM3|nr:hypothetical protein AMAG_14271 [Allomyces macrogynus ATCC 38327]|eukprot:KNE69726.1 hypothetical protein AMAG_14271 [Allomyces macrogynus ATCC 38327]